MPRVGWPDYAATELALFARELTPKPIRLASKAPSDICSSHLYKEMGYESLRVYAAVRLG